MSLKRTVYRIDGKDFEKFDMIEFPVNLQRVSIENVLKLAYKNNLWVKSFSKYFDDNTHTWVDAKMKTFNFKGCARDVSSFFEGLGVHEYDDVKFPFNLRKSDFRASTSIGEKYDGIICYTPGAGWQLKSNSPLKIEGRQRIINGKIWRKIA